MNTSEKHLLFAAMQIAYRAARLYLDRHGLRPDPEILTARIVSMVRARLPEAMADAKEALACRMDSIAEATFAASMAEAGTDAAKEASKLL